MTGALVCWDLSCSDPIVGPVVWLGDGDGYYPFHPPCAEQPWPLFDVDPYREIAQRAAAQMARDSAHAR